MKNVACLSMDMEGEDGIDGPLRKLLINVLDRAIRDLHERDASIRHETLRWFENWKNTLPYGISYKDIRDHVVLDSTRIKIIESRVSCAYRAR